MAIKSYWGASQAKTEEEFRYHMTLFKEHTTRNKDACDYLMAIDHKLWTLYAFPGKTFNIKSNNLAERAVKFIGSEMRSKAPDEIIASVMHRLTNLWISRKQMNCELKAKEQLLTNYAQDYIHNESRPAGYYMMDSSDMIAHRYKMHRNGAVITGNGQNPNPISNHVSVLGASQDGQTVILNEDFFSCSCNGHKLGLPCRHLLFVLRELKIDVFNSQHIKRFFHRAYFIENQFVLYNNVHDFPYTNFFEVQDSLQILPPHSRRYRILKNEFARIRSRMNKNQPVRSGKAPPLVCPICKSTYDHLHRDGKCSLLTARQPIATETIFMSSPIVESHSNNIAPCIPCTIVSNSKLVEKIVQYFNETQTRALSEFSKYVDLENNPSQYEEHNLPFSDWFLTKEDIDDLIAMEEIERLEMVEPNTNSSICLIDHAVGEKRPRLEEIVD